MSSETDSARQELQALLSEWRAQPAEKSADSTSSLDKDRAAALRDYQQMVRHLDDVLREHESERRSGISSNK
jgi:hypothetical protein